MCLCVCVSDEVFRSEQSARTVHTNLNFMRPSGSQEYSGPLRDRVKA